MFCHRLLNLSLASLVCLTATLATAQESVRIGGIEIGAKGVKATVAESWTDPQRPVRVLETKTINPTVFTGDKLSAETIQETTDAVQALRKWLVETMSVSASQVCIVASSSVATAVNREDLALAIREKLGIELKFLTRDEEVRLSIAGLMLRGDRTTGLFIDIGGGNTKGGTLAGGKLTTFGVDLGTLTYTTRLQTEMVLKPDALRTTELDGPLQKQLQQHPELRSAGPRYLSGGIVWAVATLTHPESMNEGLVPLKNADFVAVRRQLQEQPQTFPEPDMSRISNDQVRASAEAELARVRRVFTPENLNAGLQILESLHTTFDLDSQPLYFARNGLAAWLLGYLVERERSNDKSAGPVKPQENTGTVAQSSSSSSSTRRTEVLAFPLVNGQTGRVIARNDKLFLEVSHPCSNKALCYSVLVQTAARAGWRTVFAAVSAGSQRGSLHYDGCNYHFVVTP